MSIYKTAINKPITTILVFVGVLVMGIFSYMKLPVDQFPEFDAPFVSVMTTYPGANASEIENNVTRLLENSLNSVDGMTEITSKSKENMSLITIEFEWGYNLDEAVNDIRSSIDMVYDNLPDGVSRPLIFKFNTSMMPILGYTFTADESYPGLERILEDNVTNVLNRVEGIGNISLSGTPERRIYVNLDPQKLDAYNLTVEAVGQAVASNNLNLASGSVKMGKEQYQVRVQGEYVESSEINDIVVMTTQAGQQVFVKDIATVTDSIRDLVVDEKINGKDGVRMMIMKQSGANTVQIATDVKAEMEKIKAKLPPDIEVGVLMDSSVEIQNAINGLSESIMYALFFVVLVVLFFLGKWRATIIIGITIPISLIVAFIYLLAVDSSLNIISLCSLTIAIGMVVDDAIVVLENITKHLERGARPREAAIYATNEVWVSVIATTLVIAAVFIPLTMLSGQAGIMFKELGWIVTIVVFTSTGVAISLTPMLCSKLLKSKQMKVNERGELVEVKQKSAGWYERSVVAFLDKVDVWYANMLRWCLTHKIITLVLLVLFFAGSLTPAFMGKIGTNFMPAQDNGRLNVTIELQRGTRLEESMRMARLIEEDIMRVTPELQVISTTTGADDEGGISAMFNQSTNSKITMIVRVCKKYERERSITEISESIRTELGSRPEVIDYQVTSQQGGGGASSNNVSVEVYGYDFNQTNLFANELKHRLSEVEGARDISISREDDQAELQILFDKVKLSRHGLNEQTVAAMVRNRINGMNVGYLRESGEEYYIVARLEEEFRNSITDIEEFTMMGNHGPVKLKELARIEEYWCPPEIERKSRQRIVKVDVTPVNVSLGELAVSIQSMIDEMEIPQGVLVNVGGSYEDQQETFADMGMLLVMIILLVYIVMASQFESYAKPFIIMMSLPFALTGVILALWITGTSLDMIGALGVILLVGIVVKNGIVFVDYINLMRDRGMGLNEAIAVSGASRLRPVLMTAFTTILGMVPMALSTSEGSEMWVPMGIVVIGGAFVSTLITLIVVPVFYAVMSRSGERDKKAKEEKDYIFMNISE